MNDETHRIILSAIKDSEERLVRAVSEVKDEVSAINGRVRANREDIIRGEERLEAVKRGAGAWGATAGAAVSGTLAGIRRLWEMLAG